CLKMEIQFIHHYCTGIKLIEKPLNPLFSRGWTDNGKRLFPSVNGPVQQQKWYPPVVIAVKMRNNYHVDIVYIYALLLDTVICRSSAVEQHVCMPRSYVETRMEPSTAAESIAATNDFDRCIFHAY